MVIPVTISVIPGKSGAVHEIHEINRENLSSSQQLHIDWSAQMKFSDWFPRNVFIGPLGFHLTNQNKEQKKHK